MLGVVCFFVKGVGEKINFFILRFFLLFSSFSVVLGVIFVVLKGCSFF